MAEGWDWAVDILAEELTATPAPIRQQVLQNLLRRAGYESADAEFDHEARALNVRAELVRRLVARMEKMEEQRGAAIARRDVPSRPLLRVCEGR